MSPIGGELIHIKSLGRQIVGYVRNGEDQIAWGIVAIKMDEILQHRKGLMFRCVAQTDTRARPAPAISISTLTVKRVSGVFAAKHPVETAQLIPP
jgi:hypothetical protein